MGSAAEGSFDPSAVRCHQQLGGKFSARHHALDFPRTPQSTGWSGICLGIWSKQAAALAHSDACLIFMILIHSPPSANAVMGQRNEPHTGRQKVQYSASAATPACGITGSKHEVPRLGDDGTDLLHLHASTCATKWHKKSRSFIYIG